MDLNCSPDMVPCSSEDEEEEFPVMSQEFPLQAVPLNVQGQYSGILDYLSSQSQAL